MTEPETFTFEDDGAIPNSHLALVLYRSALPADAHDWSNSWRDGIFRYHHFHSVAHEVLGIAAGSVTVMFGGPNGRAVEASAGDVVVILAGVGHCNQDQSPDLLVVGAYPGGMEYDICRGDPADHDRVRKNIARVPLPGQDPVIGEAGPLLQLWAEGPSFSVGVRR
jgi:uncharacterized protein YjlB